MKIGFTGTQRGCTSGQLHRLRSLLLEKLPEEFHHGCCVGADTQANYEAHSLGLAVVYHPPTLTDKMSDLTDFPGEWRRPKPYLDRNHDIVDETDELIACPRESEEVLRSGTWATIRYARKLGRPVTILFR